MGGCFGLFGAYSLIPLTTCPCGTKGDIGVCRGPLALWPSCRWRQSIYHHIGCNRHLPIVEPSFATREAGQQNLVLSFTFVRVYYLTTVEGKEFLSGSSLSNLDYGSRYNDFSLVSGMCILALLSQWYSCLVQFHLRGRGWTNFSPLFITEMAKDHHLHTLQDFKSLGTSIGWICYDIAEQYWAAWGLSESVVFHVVV